MRKTDATSNSRYRQGFAGNWHKVVALIEEGSKTLIL